jgi:predicted dehydrogenase
LIPLLVKRSRVLDRIRALWHRLRRGARQARELASLPRAALANRVRIAGTPGRLGIIGCGNQGRAIAASVRQLPGWSISALYDTRIESAAALRAAHCPGAACCDSADDFWRKLDQVDVLAIATNTPSHQPLALAAIEHGCRAILLEKPVAHSLQAADELQRAAVAANCRIAVDHTRRYLDSTRGLARLLERNVVGRPHAVYFLSGHGGMANLGTHYFDLVRELFGSEIARVRAELDSADDSAARTEVCEPAGDHAGRCEAVLRSGLRVNINLSRDLSLRQLLIVILCEHGRIEVDENLGFVRLVGSGGRLWQTPLAFREALATGRAIALHELHSGAVPRCTMADGRAALEAVVAAFASHRMGGQWVDLPLAGGICEETFAFA